MSLGTLVILVKGKRGVGRERDSHAHFVRNVDVSVGYHN